MVDVFPVQVVTRGEYSMASDVYAVGCIGIEMLTGEPPWPGLMPHQAIFKVGNKIRIFCKNKIFTYSSKIWNHKIRFFVL